MFGSFLRITTSFIWSESTPKIFHENLYVLMHLQNLTWIYMCNLRVRKFWHVEIHSCANPCTENRFTVPFVWLTRRCISLIFQSSHLNPIPGRLKKVQKRAGGVNFTPLLHFGHCSQNYISDSHVYFFVGKLDKF